MLSSKNLFKTAGKGFKHHANPAHALPRIYLKPRYIDQLKIEVLKSRNQIEQANIKISETMDIIKTHTEIEEFANVLFPAIYQGILHGKEKVQVKFNKDNQNLLDFLKLVLTGYNLTFEVKSTQGIVSNNYLEIQMPESFKRISSPHFLGNNQYNEWVVPAEEQLGEVIQAAEKQIENELAELLERAEDLLCGNGGALLHCHHQCHAAYMAFKEHIEKNNFSVTKEGSHIVIERNRPTLRPRE